MPQPIRLLRTVLVAVFAAGALFSPTEAAPPTQAPGAALRLIFAGVRDGRADVGLEIALEPGWKTYWRTPGDAGIPPNFDSAGSTGIAAFDARFPLPVRFDEAGLTGIGYTRPVVLPLDVRLADPGKLADLKLAVQIGLCRDICIPLDARLSLAIDPSRPADPAAAARLAEARASLPTAARTERRPRIAALTRVAGTPTAISVEVVEPDELAAGNADLLVEGPTAEWALPLPEPVASTPGHRTWRFALDGLPKGADAVAAPLRFTLRAGTEGVEQIVALDGTGVLP